VCVQEVCWGHGSAARLLQLPDFHSGQTCTKRSLLPLPDFHSWQTSASARHLQQVVVPSCNTFAIARLGRTAARGFSPEAAARHRDQTRPLRMCAERFLIGCGDLRQQISRKIGFDNHYPHTGVQSAQEADFFQKVWQQRKSIKFIPNPCCKEE